MAYSESERLYAPWFARKTMQLRRKKAVAERPGDTPVLVLIAGGFALLVALVGYGIGHHNQGYAPPRASTTAPRETAWYPPKAPPAPEAAQDNAAGAHAASPAHPDRSRPAAKAAAIPLPEGQAYLAKQFPCTGVSLPAAYVSGPYGQWANAQSVWVVRARGAHRTAGGKSWEVVFERSYALKGSSEGAGGKLVLECWDPYDAFYLEPEQIDGQAFVVYLTRQGRFFMLTKPDFERIADK